MRASLSDGYSSAAPYDPLFWPLHGMVERYVQLVRYYAERGELGVAFDDAWGYEVT